MRLAGARGNLAPQAVGRQAGSASYLVGSPDRWRLGAPLFEKIRYSGLYPGIDLIYYGDENRVEYDFVVAPGASWRSIRLEFTGAKAVEIDKSGDLKLQTSLGWLRHRRPRVYQQLAVGFRLIGYATLCLGPGPAMRISRTARSRRVPWHRLPVRAETVTAFVIA